MQVYCCRAHLRQQIWEKASVRSASE